MIRVLSGFEAMAVQGLSANGAKGSKDSEKVFNTLLGQIDKGKAGALSQQTLQGLFNDVAEGKLSPGQAIQLIEAGEKNGQQAALFFPDSGNPAELLFQGLADGTISVPAAAALFAGMTQGGGTQIMGFEAGNSQPGQFLLELFQGVGSGTISAQAATPSAGAMDSAGGAQFASYGVGNSRSGELLQTVPQGVPGGQSGADEPVELVGAVTPADQTPG